MLSFNSQLPLITWAKQILKKEKVTAYSGHSQNYLGISLYFLWKRLFINYPQNSLNGVVNESQSFSLL